MANRKKEKNFDFVSCYISGRFAAPLRPDEIEQKKRDTVPKNTQSSNVWSCTVWKEWAVNRNMQPASIMETGYPIP